MTQANDAHTRQPSLAGRKAIITGGTTGIGRAIAVLLASEGAEVFICGRDEAHLRDALERINQVGKGDGFAIDLAEEPAVGQLFEVAQSMFGAPDIVVINAAVPASATAEEEEVDLRYQLAVDFTAYIATAHAAARAMGAGGDIVMIGSTSAVSRGPGSSIYVAAKTGLQGYAQSLRKELAEQDIKVGLIEPGFTGSDFQYPEYPPEKQSELIGKDQMLRAEDVAVATHFMLTQPRRCAVSLMRVETRLQHPPD